jgi:antagonist of KipI
MAIRIEKAGMLDTVQDLGRTGFRSLGINPGGAMDRSAMRVANLLVGNSDRAAVIETHFPAPRFLFEETVAFSVTGADLAAELNGSEIRTWSSYRAAEGDVLRFQARRRGSRSYIAVRGGFEADRWLGSESTNLFAKAGGYRGRPLKSGDSLSINKTEGSDHWLPAAGPGIIPGYSSAPSLRVTAAPESDLLSAQSVNRFFTSDFSIGRGSNRMGYRLEGPPLGLVDDIELVSSPVNFGTVQLLPDGNPVILMADAQTTGGYPRIASVIAADLPLAAQLGAGDAVRFKEVSATEAEAAALRFERDLCFLKMGIRLGRQ